MSKVFFDTNVVVYAHDLRFPTEQRAALGRMQEAIESGVGVISSQVLQEFSSVAVRKLGMAVDAVVAQIASLQVFELVLIDPGVVCRSLELSDRYGTSFWDACILAAAESANCQVVLSEDLNAGQYYGTVRVENPFIT